MRIHTQLFSLLMGAVVLSQSAFAVDCAGFPQWNSQTAYLDGDQVQFNSVGYQANWWTQDHNPADNSGQWQVWTSLGACDGSTNDNLPPVVEVNGPYASSVGELVAFSSLGSRDNDGHIAEYLWDFGDNNFSAQANPKHAYSQAGSYAITLTLTDDQGASRSATTSVTVTSSGGNGQCSAPQYQAGTNYNTNEKVTNNEREYRCDIAGWCSSSSAWAYEPGVGLHWRSAWTDLGACNGGGGDDGDGDDTNLAPTAKANGPYAGQVNQAIAFSSQGSTDSDGSIVSFYWNFGDGLSSSAETPSHSYSQAGSYQVTLIVTDNQGAQGTAQATVSVAEDDNPGQCNAPSYVAGTSYQQGDKVTNDSRLFRCDVAGWCSSNAAWAYAPGTGLYWKTAWTELDNCGDGGGSTNKPPVAKHNGPYSGQVNKSVQFSSAGSSDPDGSIVAYHWSFGDGAKSTDANPSHTYQSDGNYSTFSISDLSEM